MNYLLIKHIHMSFAALSGSFFLLRGTWMLFESPLLQQRWVRTLPHVIDSALLGSAIFLAIFSAQYPLAQSWLTAKIAALIAYIVLGSMALKRGRNRRTRAMAFIGALLAFGYIASVAITKNPRFFL